MSARTPSAKCLVRGSIGIDECFTVDDIVKPGQTISSTTFTRRAGGKGANQAVAVARAGEHVAMLGCVGSDGSWLPRMLKEAGVDVGDVQEIAEETTGRAIIQVTPSGENSIVLHKGANYTSLPPPPPDFLTSRGITHILLQNEVPLPTTLSYISVAHGSGVTTVFNPSPLPSEPEILSFPWSAVSWLVVNEHEAQSLLLALGSSSLGLASASLQSDAQLPIAQLSKDQLPSVVGAYSIVARLHAHPGFSETTNIVCTLGAAGVLALVPALPEPVYLPAVDLRGDIRDTTGAGDCFTGYLAAGLMNLHDAGSPLDADSLRDILARCVKAAGMCVERHGAMDSVPTAAEVDSR